MYRQSGGFPKKGKQTKKVELRKMDSHTSLTCSHTKWMARDARTVLSFCFRMQWTSFWNPKQSLASRCAWGKGERTIVILKLFWNCLASPWMGSQKTCLLCSVDPCVSWQTSWWVFWFYSRTDTRLLNESSKAILLGTIWMSFWQKQTRPATAPAVRWPS